MRVPFGLMCVALLAASALGTPLAAQRQWSCDSCAPSAWGARRDALEQARRALEDANRALMEKRMALYENDTSNAALDALRQAERRLAMAQRTYQAQAMDVMRAEAQEAARQTRIAMQRARVAAERDQENRRGWLGISLAAPGQQGAPRDLPVIVAVDPGSPAERAGLEAGDVLVAVDGHSLRKGTSSFERLLKPGTRIPVSIQRGDETKTVRVLVGRRPASFFFRFNTDSMDVHIPDMDWAPMPPMPPTPPMSPAPRPSAVPATPSAPLAALAPAPSLGSFYFNGVATIAGAQLWDVDQLKDYFHVRDGLLVLRVLPGTPADRAGLRSGDVIVSSDGRAMTSIHSIEHALESADERSGVHTVRLDVVRKGKRMGVGLKW